MSISLPIKIESKSQNSEVGSYSSNLSSLIYNFKKITNINYTYNTTSNPGIIRITENSNNEHVVNFSTIGNLNLKEIIIYSSPLNSYKLQNNDDSNGSSFSCEIIIVLQNESNSKNLCLFIPVKKTATENGKGKNFFNEINWVQSSDTEESSKKIEVNEIIPSGPFLYCSHVNKNIFDNLDSSIINVDKVPCIFFHNFVEISNTKYNQLFADDKYKNRNIEPVNTLDITKVFYNSLGASNSQQVYDDGLVPMECEPVEDLDGNPVFGNRFDWMKRNLDNLNDDTKNYLYVCLLILILSAILYFIWKTIFESVGKLNGPVHITKRIYSLS